MQYPTRRTILALNRHTDTLNQKRWYQALDPFQKLAYKLALVDLANARITELENNLVARKKSNRTSNQFSTKFAAVSLDKANKERFHVWFETNSSDVETYLHNLATEGWKTSFSWDQENDCFLASATMRDEDHVNYDICVTSRSGNLVEALMLNVFKIDVMHEGAKLPTEAPRNSWG